MAAIFRDAQGRDWSVVVNGRVLVRARTHGSLNIGDLFSAVDPASGKMSVDPALLLDLCFYGCEHNARIQSKKVDKDEFLEMLSGSTLIEAIRATGEALAECFAAPAKKEVPDGDADPIGEATLEMRKR